MPFYARRIVFYLITLWATISLNFLLPRLLPGDPAAIMIGKLRRANGGRPLSEETIKSIHAILGTGTGSMWDQYIAYWGRILHGDLGVSSTRYPETVSSLIGSALPWTLALVGTATIISFVLGVGIGAWVGWNVRLASPPVQAVLRCLPARFVAGAARWPNLMPPCPRSRPRRSLRFPSSTACALPHAKPASSTRTERTS